ncbi:LysM peptidoglycan-binding domain-containing protein [Pseudoalteromonas sp. SSM20]|uniref:LysM peptidoglycan-binding domain-containing protein n=1 Tax=Pseudoalteromonas sp. SSM20 TaxID=3139394 RepID=UPI003BACDEC7
MSQQWHLKVIVFVLSVLFLNTHVTAATAKTNLWLTIANNQQLPYQKHPLIDEKLKWYLQQSFYANSISLRAKPYLPYIVAELKKRNMPLELALLPIVESEFKMTSSQRGAAGIWQLMPIIAEYYNVPINEHYDGRFDLMLSTQAALSYLQDLYLAFNKDWLLAIAAYNSGEGKVKQAMLHNKRNKRPTDFWHLTLPQETREYVPKLLALDKLVKTKPRFFNAIEHKPTTRMIDIEQPFSMLVIAELLKIPNTELLKLNSAYIADKSAPTGPFHLLLPNELATTLEQILLFSRVGLEKGYRVKKGDSLYRLAKLTNTSIAKLKSLNRLTSDKLLLGQELILPASSKTMPNLVREYAISRYIKRVKPEVETLEVNYVVKPSDSLWHVATLFDVTVKQLREWNALNHTTIIKPGQTLNIKITQSKKPSSQHQLITDIALQIPYFSLTNTAPLNN